MVNVTLSVPDELKQRMDSHWHIKWSSAIRSVIKKKLDDFETAEKLAGKSRLTDEDVRKLSRKVEESMAEHAVELRK